MDLGLIFPYMDTYGGAQIFALECLKRWKKDNDITLYTVKIDKTLYDDYDLDVDIVKMDIPYKNKLMNFPFLLQQKIASKYINEHEIYNSHMFPCHALDIDNNIWYPHEPSRILYDLKVLMKDESFSKKMLYNISTPFLRYMDKNSYKSHKTVANSNYSKNYLENVYNINISDVVYPGVDIKKYNKSHEKKDENIILVVSRLYKEKNVDIAIKALTYLDNSYSMKIVGKGPYRKELEILSNQLGLQNQIQFLDFVDDETIISLYKKAVCVIFMPYKEPFGMVALESLAAGTPVIGLKNGGGYTEIIENNKTGFLVDYDEKEIAKKIRQLQDNENEYKKISQQCKRTAKKHTWDDTSKQLLEIFKKQLNQQN